MNTSAIHQAIRLNKYPREMDWLTHPNATYPDGITDLLRLCSSNNRMDTFSNKYHIETKILKSILVNFIEKVILNESNSGERLLGLEAKDNVDLVKKHYKLLLKILHPDLNDSPNANLQTIRITSAYKTLNEEIQSKKSAFKNITLSQVPPRHFQNVTNKAQQTNSGMKNAFIVMIILALVSLSIIVTQLFEPNQPQLITRAETDNTYPSSMAKPFNTTFSKTQHQSKQHSLTSDIALQETLRNLENYYENGQVDKIKPILANSPEISDQSDEQLQAKLETLFKITHERKMLLYDFNWQNFSGEAKGSGKFLSRYQLIGQKIWKTRKGQASITVELVDNHLKIIKFQLENSDIN